MCHGSNLTLPWIYFKSRQKNPDAKTNAGTLKLIYNLLFIPIYLQRLCASATHPLFFLTIPLPLS
jgi:hypothetical protein